MAVKIPPGDETEMNMTPMIDIVFQLIIFFLLSLKFKTVDQRIQSELPKDRGIQATSQIVEELPLITVKLFRDKIDDDDETNDYTKIRIGNGPTFKLPEGEWSGVQAEDEVRQKQYDVIFAKVTAHLKSVWAQQGNNPEIKGEIKTPPPKGVAVPHGDVVLILDALLQTGIQDVTFEGAMPPMPKGGAGGIITDN